MYSARAVAITGRVGLARALDERMILVVAYVLVSLTIAYRSVVVLLARNVINAIGWYLYPVVVPEIVLLFLGFRGLFGTHWSLRAVVCACILVVALDLCTVHFLLMPCYSGMTAHRPLGSLSSIRLVCWQADWPRCFRGCRSIGRPGGCGRHGCHVGWVHLF